VEGTGGEEEATAEPKQEQAAADLSRQKKQKQKQKRKHKVWDAAAVRDRHGLTALQWAAGGGHLEVVEYLLQPRLV
jgi:ankyrin repeat protein